MDFQTDPLDAWIERKTLGKLRRAERYWTESKLLEQKLKDLTTRLTPAQKRFVLGNPMRFRLELVNDSTVELLYDDQQAHLNQSLTVVDNRGRVMPYILGPSNTGGNFKSIQPNSSVVIFDGLDVAKQYEISRQGRYAFQFNGSGLKVGGMMQEGYRDNFNNVISSPRIIPSNVVQIDVTK